LRRFLLHVLPKGFRDDPMRGYLEAWIDLDGDDAQRCRCAADASLCGLLDPSRDRDGNSCSGARGRCREMSAVRGALSASS
jgi:hypothetical protein